MQETQVRSLGLSGIYSLYIYIYMSLYLYNLYIYNPQEDLLEQEMDTHSSIPSGIISWIEEPSCFHGVTKS